MLDKVVDGVHLTNADAADLRADLDVPRKPGS